MEIADEVRGMLLMWARLSEGVESYVVGGFVRDMLVNRRSDDIDIVIVPKDEPRKTISNLSQSLGSSLPGSSVRFYPSFATATVETSSVRNRHSIF